MGMMVYSVEGVVASKSDRAVVIEVLGIGFKCSVGRRTSTGLPKIGEKAILYSHLHLHEGGHEGGVELYGFLSPEDLSFFEQLLSVSGVGPKSALALLDVT